MSLDPLNLPPSAAAKLAGISRSMMFDLIASGEIKSFKPSTRKRLIPVSEIRAWGERQITLGSSRG